MDENEKKLLELKREKKVKFDENLELKIRDYVDRNFHNIYKNLIESIKEKLITDLLSQMEKDYRELAGYCEGKKTKEALENVVIFSKDARVNGQLV